MKRKNTGLVFMISLAAFMLLGLQSVVAQDSATKQATAGRFTTDVDNFMGVNDWAGVDMQKWFGFLQVKNIDASGASTPDLEAGLAFKVKELYFGAYYKGRYSTGEIDWSLVNGEGTGPATTLAGLSSVVGTDGVDNSSSFALLVGFKNTGIKLGITDKTWRYERPELGVSDATDDVNGKYYFRDLQGELTPSIKWGVTTPFAMGKFAVKPNAELAVKINFDQQTLTQEGVQKYYNANNTVTPTLSLDSGGVDIFTGDWGILAVGIADKFAYAVRPEADPSPATDSTSDYWFNNLAPYVTFRQSFTPAFGLKAKLNLPLGIGSSTDSGSYAIAFGNLGKADLDPYNPPYGEYKTVGDAGYVQVGAQYAFKEGKLADKLVLNLGVQVNLPIYTFMNDIQNDTPLADDQTENKAQKWTQPAKLQAVSLGAQFKFSKYVMLDWKVDFLGGGGGDRNHATLTDNAIWDTLFSGNSLVFTAKY
ncbi:hypothetical protein AGMMS49940_21320 [Spirochaetia bacterium]|nr:hypothetical protein AGMMS49940_21320 [Spirochaetia bacterium]